MKQMRVFVLLVAAAVLAACAQLGLPTADTFNQKVAVAYGTVQSVLDTTTQLLVAKKITVDDAKRVEASAVAAKAGIDAARTLHATDPTGAETKIDAIKATLTALTTFLAAQQAAKGG